MYISLWENSRGHPDNVSFMQFSMKIDGFEQKDSQGFENSYNSYEQYPLEKFFIFTIYQNYTLALRLEKLCHLIATLYTEKIIFMFSESEVFRMFSVYIFTKHNFALLALVVQKEQFVHPQYTQHVYGCNFVVFVRFVIS